MYTVFVIGNIASGKSTASRYLAQKGGRLIDLDQVAKDLYQPGSDVVLELVEAFGHRVLDFDGGIDRRELARVAFSTPESVATLNGIVHPRVLKHLGDLIVPPYCCTASEPANPFTVVEISVAADFTEAFPLADEIMAITSPLDIRRARAIERGMTPFDFDQRAAAQPSEDELCAMATYRIDNSAADRTLFEALDEWLALRGLDGSQDGFSGLSDASPDVDPHRAEEGR